MSYGGGNLYGQRKWPKWKHIKQNPSKYLQDGARKKIFKKEFTGAMAFIGPESGGKNIFSIFHVFHAYISCLYSITRCVISCQGGIFWGSEGWNTWSNLKKANL